MNVTVLIGIFTICTNVQLYWFHIENESYHAKITFELEKISLPSLLSLKYTFFFSFSSSMKSSQHGEATYISTICWSHINQPKQIMQWHSVRWGGDKLIPYKWGIKQCIMTFDFSSLNVIAKMWGSKSQCDLLFHIYVV